MKKWVIGIILVVILCCGGFFLLNLFAPRSLLELVALPFYPIFSRTAPEGTGGTVGVSKWGIIDDVGPIPLSISCSRVNWKGYTDEKGVKRYGPVAKLGLRRRDEDKYFEFISVYAGQHINWNIFSLYVEQIIYFPESIRVRVFINVSPIGERRHGEFVEKLYPHYVSTQPAHETGIPKNVGLKDSIAP